MRYHPLQGNKDARERLASIFKEKIESRGILPKNPWKAKRLGDWLAKMGARFHPASNSFRPFGLEHAKFYSFEVHCPTSAVDKNKRGPLKFRRIRGRRESRWVVIEIPWELADKVLVLGYLP